MIYCRQTGPNAAVDYSFAELRRDNPGVSFPAEPSEALLAQYGVFRAVETGTPAYDPIAYRIERGDFAQVGGQWVRQWRVIPLTPEQRAGADYDRTLSPAQMKFLLAYTGLEDVWQAMLAATKDTDRVTYAMLTGWLAQPAYRLGRTLETVAGLAPQIAAVAPDVDLSEAAIRAAWDRAEQVDI